nr:peptide chain release factor-like protein [Candidatus Paceibacterota bacterium]
TERKQLANREKAMQILISKLEMLKEQEEAEKYSSERKEQIGTSDRSEKIRTYNFPQDRVTDHRIKESWSNLPSIMEGNIEKIIEALSGGLTKGK